MGRLLKLFFHDDGDVVERKFGLCFEREEDFFLFKKVT